MPSPNKKVNQVAISDEERCFATLIASGLWTQADAHRMSFKDSKLKDDSQRRMLGSNMAKRPQVIAYIQTALLSYVQEKGKAASGSGVLFDSDFATGDNGMLTKDDIRRLMTANIQRETDAVKQNKLLEQLAVLDALKGNNDVGGADDKVMFYTPLTCIEKCHLYKKEQVRLREEKERVNKK